MIRRRRALLLLAGGTLLFLAAAGVVVAGALVQSRWAGSVIYILGRPPGTQNWIKPPFPPLSYLEATSLHAAFTDDHLFVLGSDAAGRDLMGLIGRGAVPSGLLVLSAIAGRLALGLAAGILMSRGSRLVRLLARGAGRWIAGFPYLVVGVVVVQVLSPWSRFGAFVLAMTLVGWRDVAEVTAERVEAVMRREFAEAARALGTPALRFARLHLLPELAPALSLELLFQASAVIVLLGELGYLNVYLSAHTLALLEQTGGGRGPSLAAFQVAQQPELGQLLSGARNYILQEQWAPVLIPGALLAAFALAFELLGSGLRARLSVRR